MFKFALALLDELKDHIMNMDLISITKFFRENNGKLHFNTDKLLNKAQNFKITSKELDFLREEYFIEQIKKKLNVNKKL